MTIRARALVFSTFFGSCVAIGLLLVSLTTEQWVTAYPRRHNSEKLFGEVNYGLFSGNKHLNSGAGLRHSKFSVYSFIVEEPGSMNFWLWLLTALGTGFGLFSCAVAAIAAVLKSASSAKKGGTTALLLVSNISAACAQVIAFICWFIQFEQYLMHNVLTREDHSKNWYSRGLAHLGYSFYLVIASTIVVLFNIAIIMYAKRCENSHLRRLEPPSVEKNQSAIMLY